MVLSQLLPSLGFDGSPWEKAAHGPDLEGFQPLPKDRGGSGCGMCLPWRAELILVF